MDATAAATLVLASATVLLAFVTVFGDWIRGWFFKPRLQIDISNSDKYIWSNMNWLSGEPVQDAMVRSPSPSPTPRPGEPGPDLRIYWIRFGITNRLTSFSIAGEDIEVFVSSLKRVGAPESRSFVGFNLKWALGENVTQMGILPGVTKYCDLGRLWQPSGRNRFREYSPSYSEAENRNLFEFAAFPQPRNFSFLLEPGRYELTLLVGGKNAKVRPYTLTFELPGEWRENENEMREAITVGLAHGVTVLRYIRRFK